MLVLWQQYGTGEKRRMLPLRHISSKLEISLAKVVIKAHIITGHVCLSKVGTKHAALACDPVQYLTNFGGTKFLSDQDAAMAEKLLIRC